MILQVIVELDLNGFIGGLKRNPKMGVETVMRAFVASKVAEHAATILNQGNQDPLREDILGGEGEKIGILMTRTVI